MGKGLLSIEGHNLQCLLFYSAQQTNTSLGFILFCLFNFLSHLSENMIYKGLDEEDATFLSTVSEKQAEIHNRRFAEESSELLSYRISFH